MKKIKLFKSIQILIEYAKYFHIIQTLLNSNKSPTIYHLKLQLCRKCINSFKLLWIHTYLNLKNNKCLKRDDLKLMRYNLTYMSNLLSWILYQVLFLYYMILLHEVIAWHSELLENALNSLFFLFLIDWITKNNKVQ